MPSLWKFGGLTPLKLTQLAIKKISEDELSTRSASLCYYFLLALFPMFLFLVSLVGVFAGPGSQLRESIVSGLGRLAPGSASALVQSVVNQTFKNSSGTKLAAGILGALWAASGGMDAVMVSLNVIYGVTENRPWWKQKLTIVGLTVTLAGPHHHRVGFGALRRKNRSGDCDPCRSGRCIWNGVDPLLELFIHTEQLISSLSGVRW